MFKKPDAISLAPIWRGIKRLENVPLKPAVKTKNTIIVPWIVTKAKYMFGSITPSGAHFPNKASKIGWPSSGQANCILTKQTLLLL